MGEGVCNKTAYDKSSAMWKGAHRELGRERKTEERPQKNVLCPPNELGLYFLSNILINQGRVTVTTTLNFSILKVILYQYCDLFTHDGM